MAGRWREMHPPGSHDERTKRRLTENGRYGREGWVEGGESRWNPTFGSSISLSGVSGHTHCLSDVMRAKGLIMLASSWIRSLLSTAAGFRAR